MFFQTPFFHQTIGRTALRWTVATTLVLGISANSYGQAGKQRGATLGGLTGAVAGALIGDHNGEAGAGAAIGGVVGAVAGGLLGNANDKENAIRQQQQYYQAQQSAMVATQGAVSIADVATMSRSGLSDSVIVNQVKQRGVQQALNVPDIIALHQAGVSETVITAMQQSPTGTQRMARVQQPVAVQPIIQQTPVYVEERMVVPSYDPHYYRPHPHYYHHHPRPVPYRSGVHIRF
ncbi:hypothetical protein CA13_71920 [Planctomycetes bacterium CA13]|uniref:Glycine zipper domain-containing protein n=1 Tax=Novipirellula herctigrandis TaxID=2527986 RepID=A0A5C5YP73_9BACT|nr:hypothetical protein CA13_71920 [Planctomycetes bacterium CA13]